MSQSLAPCPSCNRHVLADACVCPFCAARLRVCAAPRAGATGAHLSRTARLAAGAALAGVAACGGPTPAPPYGTPPPHDASHDVAADGGAEDGAGGTTGLPDARAPLLDGSRDAPPVSDAAQDRAVVPIYGAAIPTPRKPVP